MRFIAVVPILLCAASFVLAFLCLFAGSREGWMEDYPIITLNTSQLGQNILESSSSSDGLVGSIIDNIPDSIQDEIEDAITSVAQRFGLHDWYSYHLMTYCEGYYEPGPVPNATLSKSDISKNTTNCSNRTAMYNFDPQDILQNELDEAGTGLDLSSFNWPDSIQEGIDALRIAAKATFALYCIAIGFIGVALVSAIIGFFLEGRLSALVNVILDWLAFVVLGIASGIATAIAVKTSDVINEYGNDIGVSANKGNKFLIITWVGTGLLLVASIVWCFGCIAGSRRKSRSTGPKYG